MSSNQWRGNTIHKDDEEWRYTSDNTLVALDANRKCGHCGKENTKEGHDGCLGVLGDIMNACCGHGVDAEAYVQMNNGKIISGSAAKIVIRQTIDNYLLKPNQP